MKKYLRGIWFGLEYILLNHFVCHIPSWSIRKFFFVLFGIKIGKHSRIGMDTTIVCPKKIKIGYNTIINEKCHLDGRGKLEIGNNTSISFGTVIITATHQLSDFAYREENGSFKDRKELLKVPKLGAKAFEQCAGFLRIIGGKNPLDATAVHPESYAATEKLLEILDIKMDKTVVTSIEKEAADKLRKLGKAEKEKLAADIGVGEMTLDDINWLSSKGLGTLSQKSEALDFNQYIENNHQI